jgi:VanZ family protein
VRSIPQQPNRSEQVRKAHICQTNVQFRLTSDNMPMIKSLLSVASQGPKAARIAAWALTATIIILSLVPPNLRPETGAPHILEHFIIYAVTGLTFGLGFRRRHDLLAIFLVIFSGSIEIAQLFVPGRHARLTDFIINAVSACIGLVTVSLLSIVRPAAPFRTMDGLRASQPSRLLWSVWRSGIVSRLGGKRVDRPCRRINPRPRVRLKERRL